EGAAALPVNQFDLDLEPALFLCRSDRSEEDLIHPGPGTTQGRKRREAAFGWDLDLARAECGRVQHGETLALEGRGELLPIELARLGIEARRIEAGQRDGGRRLLCCSDGEGEQ